MVAGIRDDGTTTDIFILPLAAALDGTPATEQDLIFPLASSANEQHASFSPDGRWIAYTSDESGRDEVYVLPVAGPGGPKIVSREGGWQPRWHPAGNEILFLAPGGTVMLAVDVDGSGAEFRVGTPYALFDLLPTDFSSSTSSLFSVMADGRMVMLQREVSTVGAARLNIVENWFGELLERAPLSGLPP
jgi:dipeptidyl aminopeptidase/acylaminoacyl peptidase